MIYIYKYMSDLFCVTSLLTFLDKPLFIPFSGSIKLLQSWNRAELVFRTSVDLIIYFMNLEKRDKRACYSQNIA